MKEFGTPRFGNTPNQSPLKASLMPLDDNQSVSVSCKETDTQIHIPDFSCWVGACPAPSLLDSSGRAGLRDWSQDKRVTLCGWVPCQLRLLQLPLVTVGWQGSFQRGASDPLWLDTGTEVTAWATYIGERFLWNLGSRCVWSHGSITFKVSVCATRADGKPAYCFRVTCQPGFWGQGIQVLSSKVYWTQSKPASSSDGRQTDRQARLSRQSVYSAQKCQRCHLGQFSLPADQHPGLRGPLQS